MRSGLLVQGLPELTEDAAVMHVFMDQDIGGGYQPILHDILVGSNRVLDPLRQFGHTSNLVDQSPIINILSASSLVWT